jgi:hypothetical protein
LVERVLGKDEVTSSILVIGSSQYIQRTTFGFRLHAPALGHQWASLRPNCRIASSTPILNPYFCSNSAGLAREQSDIEHIAAGIFSSF